MVDVAYRDASRIQFLDAPINLPGICIVCGSSNNQDRKYADLGLFIETIGSIYFCTMCLTEAFNLLGCLSAEQTLELETKVKNYEEYFLEVQAKELAVNDAIDRLRATGLFNTTDTDYSIPSVANDEEPDYLFDYDALSSGQPEQNNPESEQSDSKQRSNRLSGTSGFDGSSL